MDQSTGGARPIPVIRGKLAVPAPADHVVDRPRLLELLAGVVERHPVVVVSATAGAGKTTAVAAATALLGRPVAWLAVDRPDAAPGRLVAYLEAALAERLPRLRGIATEALAAGAPPVEAVGLLAEAIGDDPPVLVLDDLERLAEDPEPWTVVEALGRYLPPTSRLVLVSRHDVPAERCALPADRLGAIGDAALAFTEAEAAAALRKAGRADVDAAAAVASTGGWVTGVLFEAWRSDEHVAGAGGEADPLHGYLSSQILAQLDPEDRELLLVTSLLEEVTAERAEALGVRRPGERLARLRAAHLPVTWSADGRAMRCHPRFREVLQERLERRGARELRPLRLAHARRLREEGRHEEATEELLRVGAPEEARAAAEAAVVGVIERTDFAVAERWIARLAPTPDASPLTTARLMAAIARDDVREVVRIGDLLAADGLRDRLAATSDTAAWILGWAYIHALRPDDVVAVLDAARPGSAVDALRYAFHVMADPADEAPPPRPALDRGGSAAAMAYVADYGLGRFAELAQADGTPWVEAVKAPWRIAALRATGRTQEALELHRTAGRAADALIVQAFTGPELLLDAGRVDEARELLERGRAHARRCGSLATEAMSVLTEAKLVLRADRDPTRARAILDRADFRAACARFRHVDEGAATWRGLALLLEGADAAAAAELRRAVAGMRAGGRLLELPTAAVYLSEAAWRLGAEDEADAAAAIALDAAERQGADHLLLQALADAPAVVARQLDAQRDADSPWHRVARALRAQEQAGGRAPVSGRREQAVDLAGRPGAAGDAAAPAGGSRSGTGTPTGDRADRPRALLIEFGRRALLVGDEERRPRIAKSYEVLAYLAARPGGRAARDELLDALFDGRSDDSARAYLRQAVLWLRRALGEGALSTAPGVVALADAVALVSESTTFERRLAEAARLRGEERLAATLEALAVHDRGAYLPGARSRWADDRAQRLDDLAADAAFDAAEVALGLARTDEARRLVERALATQPFREEAFRLLMRAHQMRGDEQGVIRAYRACERALAEVDARPSASTERLLERLRA